MTARRDFSFLQTKAQANSLVRLGYDVVARKITITKHSFR